MFFKKPKKEFGSSYDYMFVGLGNPGREYEATRHNAGFLSLDTLAEKYDCQINKLKFKDKQKKPQKPIKAFEVLYYWN